MSDASREQRSEVVHRKLIGFVNEEMDEVALYDSLMEDDKDVLAWAVMTLAIFVKRSASGIPEVERPKVAKHTARQAWALFVCQPVTLLPRSRDSG